ncbi:MAG: hypothetical protein WC744_03890 [Patescibacteria group bacterium]|jgi:hypothetical protein
MDASNSPEQQNNQQQAREAASRIAAEVRDSNNARYAAVDKISNDAERQRQRDLLDAEISNSIRARMRDQIARDKADVGTTDSPENIKAKADDAKRSLLEIKDLNEKNRVNVVDRRSQFLLDKIVEQIKNGEITDQGVLDVERILGKHLIDGIVFSQPGEQMSDFEKDLKTYYEINPIAATPLVRNLLQNPETYGYGDPKSLSDKISPSKQEETPTEQEDDQKNKPQKEMTEADMDMQRFQADYQYYQNRFTNEQLKLISAFYSPEAIVNYMEKLSIGDDQDKSFLTTQQVKERKEQLKKDIEEYYQKNNKTFEPGNSLEDQVEKHWGEEVSEMMNWRMSDIVNQLFLELQQKSPHKFYEQIMQEDIFTGPSMIQKKIQTAINALMTRVDQLEGKDANSTELTQRMAKLQLYRYATKGHEIEERSDDPNDKNKKIYPRIKPIPYGEKINLGVFIEYVNMTIDQTIHKTEYFHNARAIYKHPPGEKGFYQKLGDFAEQLQGTDIEEILMLPDGQYVLEAYQLYEKMLQEDFAQMDHRHRPDQLTNKLERVNSEIEEEVIAQLIKFYPDLSRQRVKNIVNNAVGVSRGMFLTEAEQSAYADPVDSEGKGMVASYSTNDAGSLNAFNPMHTIMRWQGEHNFNAMYFMPVKGESGPWDHRKAWKNMQKYMDSFYVGKGRGVGKNGLPEEVFADSMMNIGKIGGPGIRKGWRMKQALEGHFVYDDDGTIDAPNTFQAMEAIGYEALYNFVNLKQAGPGLMKATEKINPKELKERKKLFTYIYKKYFYTGDSQDFQESEFDNYMTELQKKGEEKALKAMKGEVRGRENEKGSLSAGSWEEQVAYETSQMFLENMLAHYTAARMPTKFLRIDKNRLHKDGIGNWERVWREFRDRKDNPWQRKDFDHVMKDLGTAEMLLRRQIGKIIRDQIKFDKDWTLDKIDEIRDLPHRLTSNKIRELLSENSSENPNRENKTFKNKDEIDRVVELYEHIMKDFENNEYLDNKGYKEISDFKFTFGLEDTDLSLMAFRGTGPRMAARAIKDTATIETVIVPWIINMPLVLNEIAISGKNDFTPIIKYMREAQKAITDVNGVEDTYEFMYKLAGTAINYFKKDAMAKPLFGLFRLGKINSIAGQYAGRSSAVVEWDSRDIDRFIITMESYGLLKNSPYNLQAKGNNDEFSGGLWEDRWVINPLTKKPMKWGKKRHVDYKYNSLRLRKEHGADGKAIMWDYVNQFLPLAVILLLWKYIKDALDETEGKKK